MPQISIGRAEPVEILLQRLSTQTEGFAQDGVSVSFNIQDVNGVRFLECDFDGPEDKLPMLVKKQLVGALAEMVLESCEGRLVQEILHRYHNYLRPDELTQVENRVEKTLNTEADVVARNQRKAKVIARLEEYMDEQQDRLDLDGFVRFRLKDYQQDLHSSVSRIVDDFLMEKEHREFVQLLRYFVELQKPKVDTVQILLSSNGFFKILDLDDHPIHAEYLDGINLSTSNRELNYDDLLISTLITIAPAHLIVHKKTFQDMELVDTICSVFEGKTVLCDGCALCDQP